MIEVKENKAIDASTEEKIKIAARTVFHKKGFAAARTRDIAEEAGINLALLNYYYRSKEKLFQIIMQETMTIFSQGMIGALNDENTTFEEKIELFVANYFDMVCKEPEILLFILGELRSQPENFSKNLPVQLMLNSTFIQQFQKKVAKGEIKEPNPLQFMMNLMGLTALPFLVKPLFSAVGLLQDEQFNQMMQHRKSLIPVWMDAIMKTQ
jgi:AcrR family transcriptional regulator